MTRPHVKERVGNNFPASGGCGCLGSQPDGQAPRCSARAARLGAAPAGGRLDPSHPEFASQWGTQFRPIPDPLAGRPFDAIVLGGGPAGTATARMLALGGRSVVVLERSHYDALRIGETVPPEIRLPLTDLGLWERFVADGHIPSPGNVSAWDSPELDHDDFIVNPFGPGWHLDRRRFDAMLALAAEQAGAAVLRDARPIACARDPAGHWQVTALLATGPALLRAPLLVDATGRASSPARRLGGRRLVYDRLIGLARFAASDSGCDTAGADRRTLVEAVEAGWWYSAPLPEARRIVAFMTDADLLPRDQLALPAFWRDQLLQAPHTAARLGPDIEKAATRLLAANTTRMSFIARRGRLAVGDAAATLDPLSSLGIYRALDSALDAAQAAEQYLRGERRSLAPYARHIASTFKDYLRTRAEYYARVRRWPQAPFWERRRSTIRG